MCNFSEGTHTINAWVNNTPGRTNTTSITFRVDLTPPQIYVTSPISKNYNIAVVCMLSLLFH
jgi:hypothetical protein